jgi:hypothetical protein
MDSKAEKIALFRYGVIATLVLEKLPHGELIRRARDLADRDYDIPFSNRRRLCVDTLLHWAVRYRTGGLEALAQLPPLLGTDRALHVQKPFIFRALFSSAPVSSIDKLQI